MLHAGSRLTRQVIRLLARQRARRACADELSVRPRVGPLRASQRMRSDEHKGWVRGGAPAVDSPPSPRHLDAHTRPRPTPMPLRSCAVLSSTVDRREALEEELLHRRAPSYDIVSEVHTHR